MSRTLYMLLFASVALLVLGGAHRYVWTRLVRDPALPSPWRQLATGLITALGVILFASPVAWHFAGVAAPAWASATAFTWLGTLFLLGTFLGGADLLRLLRSGLARVSRRGVPFDPDRRRVLARFGAAGAGLGAVGLSSRGVWAATRDPAIQEVLVPIRGLPAGAEGLRILQLSDLHVSATLRRPFVRRVVELANAQRPDLVVITGDLVDGTVPMLRDDVAPLADLRSRYGTFFCTGNHDYYSGVGPWMRELRRIGVRPLRNARVAIGQGEAAIDLAGIDDFHARRVGAAGGPDLARALSGRDPARPVVLLAHQPRAIDEAARAGVDLVLSGHTHGGQIWPFGHLVALTQPYLSGLHRHGQTWIYVSRGTGYWGPPMRLGAPHEVTVVTLTSA